MLDGTAKKDSQVIDFIIKLNDELDYTCGEFIGEVRKGLVKALSNAELEVTFHFDHIFGNGEIAADETTNTEVLGFSPLAALAEGITLKVDQENLKTQLSTRDYQTLEKAIAGLGHVGEGHCR